MLWTVARRGAVYDFRSLLTCLNEQLAGEHVRNTLTSLFKTFVPKPCSFSVMGLKSASPPKWQLGHTLDLAVRSNKLRNVCGAGV